MSQKPTDAAARRALLLNLSPWLFFIGLIVLWELVCRVFELPTYVLPAPSEIGKALEGLGSTMNNLQGIPQETSGPAKRVDMGPSEPAVPASGKSSADDAVQAAIKEAQAAANPRRGSSAAGGTEQSGPAGGEDPLG